MRAGKATRSEHRQGNRASKPCQTRSAGPLLQAEPRAILEAGLCYQTHLFREAKLWTLRFGSSLLRSERRLRNGFWRLQGGRGAGRAHREAREGGTTAQFGILAQKNWRFSLRESPLSGIGMFGPAARNARAAGAHAASGSAEPASPKFPNLCTTKPAGGRASKSSASRILPSAPARAAPRPQSGCPICGEESRVGAQACNSGNSGAGRLLRAP